MGINENIRTFVSHSLLPSGIVHHEMLFQLLRATLSGTGDFRLPDELF